MYTHKKAMSLNNLANYYAVNKHYVKAVEHYRKALTLYDILAEEKPFEYGIYMADILNNLSMLYLDMNRMAKSKELHENALSIYRELAKQNPHRFAIELVQCLVDGVIYLKEHSFTLYEAEMALYKIKEIGEAEHLMKAIRKLHQ